MRLRPITGARREGGMRPAPRRTLTAECLLLVGGGCVDRDEVFRALERHGCSTTAVGTGQEALAALRQNKPAAVVVDAATPGTDGYALCRWIKAEEELRDVTVLLALPLQRRTEVVRCLECGADGFLAAPYDGEALWERMRYAAANRRSPAEGAPAGMEFACCGQRHRVQTRRRSGCWTCWSAPSSRPCAPAGSCPVPARPLGPSPSAWTSRCSAARRPWPPASRRRRNSGARGRRRAASWTARAWPSA